MTTRSTPRSAARVVCSSAARSAPTTTPTSGLRHYTGTNPDIAFTWTDGTPSIDRINDIAIDSEGNIVVVGEVSPNDTTHWIGRFGPDGTEQWTKEYPEGIPQEATRIAIDPQDRIVTAGGVGDNALVRKVDPADGAVIWERDYLDARTVRGLVVDGAGDIVFCAQGINNMANILIFKIRG